MDEKLVDEYIDGLLNEIKVLKEQIKILQVERKTVCTNEGEQEICDHIWKAYPMPEFVKCIKCGKQYSNNEQIRFT